MSHSFTGSAVPGPVSPLLMKILSFALQAKCLEGQVNVQWSSFTGVLCWSEGVRYPVQNTKWSGYCLWWLFWVHSLLSLTGEHSLVFPTPTYLAFFGESERDANCCTVSLSDMRSSRFFCWTLWAWQFGVTLPLGNFPPLVINGVGYGCCLADVVFVLLVEKW